MPRLILEALWDHCFIYRTIEVTTLATKLTTAQADPWWQAAWNDPNTCRKTDYVRPWQQTTTKTGQDIPKTVATWRAWQWNYVNLIGFEQFGSMNCDCTMPATSPEIREFAPFFCRRLLQLHTINDGYMPSSNGRCRFWEFQPKL